MRNVIVMKELTKREKEILVHVLNGLSDKEIAEKEFVELSTVKTHVQNIYKHYNIHSRIKLIVKFYKQNRRVKKQ
jgi:DNA-binding NarL/FixJ family response regulator